jgi:hypothetical protein
MCGCGNVDEPNCGAPVGSCEPFVGYDTSVGCNGTFKATTIADLQEYALDFGRENGSKFKNLKLMADLTAGNLDIKSPCAISFLDDIVLTADTIKLDGYKGVLDDNGYGIFADYACIVSESERAGMGKSSVVDAGALDIRAAKRAKIGLNSTVDVAGKLSIISSGDFGTSTALLRAHSVANVGELEIISSRGTWIGDSVTANVSGPASIVSTGDFTNSDAGIKMGSHVNVAGPLNISASGTAKVGQATVVNVAGPATVTSTGAKTGSLAIVKSGAVLTVSGDLDLTSGTKATVGQNTTVVVTGTMTMDGGAKCTINSSSNISYALSDGNCL